MSNLTVADLKAMAAPMALDLARELAPGGSVSGNYYLTRSPLRADRKAGSFCVWIRGAAAGAWKDFAADDKGDLVDLIAEVKYEGRTREGRGKAIGWLRERLGVARGAPAEILARARTQARAAQAQREAQEAASRERKRKRCLDLWMDGKPLGGTLGEVYYRERGIEAAEIPNKSSTFRFLRRLDYWKGGAAPHAGPAIIGRYRDALGAAPAIHATWLSEDGRAKAELDPAKLYGEYKGLFLPIARGLSGLEPWDQDCPPGPVQVSEGPEDGWSVAQARPDLRTWAAGSLSNIGNLPCPPCVNAFLVVRQNDWSTPAAVAAFDKALEALARHGVPVAAIAVGVGKDPNDQLRGRA